MNNIEQSLSDQEKKVAGKYPPASYAFCNLICRNILIYNLIYRAGGIVYHTHN